MPAQRNQGAEMPPRLTLRRRAVPDRAVQPTHSGERERSLRAETQQPVRQRQILLVDLPPSRGGVHLLIIRRSHERDTDAPTDVETEMAEEEGPEMAGPVRASPSDRQPYSA